MTTSNDTPSLTSEIRKAKEATSQLSSKKLLSSGGGSSAKCLSRRSVTQEANNFTSKLQASANDLAQSVKCFTGKVKGEASHYFDQASHYARSYGSKVMASTKQMTEDSPITMLAGATLLGAGIGYLLPRTRNEDRIFGAQADKLKLSAKSKVMNSARKATEQNSSTSVM